MGASGEAASEYLALYKSLMTQDHWRFYLSLRGVLTLIGRLMGDEIDKLTQLEETSLTSDLSLGFAMKALTGACACAVRMRDCYIYFDTQTMCVCVFFSVSHNNYTMMHVRAPTQVITF